ncbi:MAG: IS30 family transposase [Selenomonadaceae bacterium]|nr:IS30 family transposase [Selenomonadaceae bacterium]
MSYKHLSITERELLLIHLMQGLSLCKIAKLLGRNKSTISRELARNKGEYLPSKAQAHYKRRRKKCRPHKLLENPELFASVKKLFLNKHWSPEQIANRLKLENYPIQISYKTIYRAIYAGMFDTPEQKRSEGNRGARRKLRHRGKPRRPKGYVSNRGKIPISHELSARPVAANERIRRGDWEADTIVGFNRKSGLLTLVDRKSRFLLVAPLSRLGSKEVKTALIEVLRGQPLHTITPDRGREFQLHGKVTTELGVEFYFPPPHQPWQRGTNENTNGLLREYFPKGYDFTHLSEEDLQAVVEQLNHRPRKSLGYRTPAEVYFSTLLHLA